MLSTASPRILVPIAAAAAIGLAAAPAGAADPVPPRPKASAPCPPTHAASAAPVTSKARHIPNEDDACADSRGIARPAGAASAPAKP
ncbi:MAG: hypothetical protein JO224_04125 [Pelomonas sp.]|nr:hypothetical protein [Roseateles sp.]